MKGCSLIDWSPGGFINLNRCYPEIYSIFRKSVYDHSVFLKWKNDLFNGETYEKNPFHFTRSQTSSPFDVSDIDDLSGLAVGYGEYITTVKPLFWSARTKSWARRFGISLRSVYLVPFNIRFFVAGAKMVLTEEVDRDLKLVKGTQGVVQGW